MAKRKASMAAVLKGLPKQVVAAYGREAAAGIGSWGKVRVFPYGTPYPDEWVVSVLPHTANDAKRLIDLLINRGGRARFEVFPYGILNPEIARIDIRLGR